MHRRLEPVFANIWSPAILIAAICLLTAIAALSGSERVQFLLVEMMIRVIVVVGMFAFIGNSGVLSFGHIGFMCIGAYAAAWVTCDPGWKELMLPSLPAVLRNHEYSFPVALAVSGGLAALVAFALGAVIMRLSGIAASIATFAFLMIVNNVYANWDSVTAGTSSVVNIPTAVGPWGAFLLASLTIIGVHAFQVSRFGLMLRSSRDDEIAAKSAAVPVVFVRLVGFVVSAFFVGIGGALYAQFIGFLSPDSLYLDVTFVTLAMLVIGGTGSLFGAVVGVATVTSIVEFLRLGEDSSGIGAQTISLPSGSQQVALAALMAIILILRPAGLTNGREIPLPKWLRSRWKVGDCGRLGVAPRPDGTAPPSAGEIELDQADGSSQR